MGARSGIVIGRGCSDISIAHSDQRCISCMCIVSGVKIVLGAWDCDLSVWDLTDWHYYGKLEGHACMVVDVAALSDECVVSCGYDRQIIVWNILTMERLYTFRERDSSVRSFVIDRDSSLSLVIADQ